MPSSPYVAAHEPPSLSDRIMQHPYTLVMSLVAFSLGVQIVVSVFVPDFIVSRAIEHSDTWTKLAMSAPLLVGGPISVYGAINPGYRLSRVKAWAVEQAGDAAVGAGWIAFGASVALSGNVFGTFTAQVLLGLGIAYMVRVAACWISERRVRRVLEAEKLGR